MLDAKAENKGNGLFDIIGCSAGAMYSSNVIVKICDFSGNKGHYLYDPQSGFYQKVDPDTPNMQGKPCRYFGSPEREEQRSRAYGFI